MNLTDDPQAEYKTQWRGKLTPVHPRFKKTIYLRDKYAIDGETATQAITIGSMLEREVFVDQLPDVICYDGETGLNEAFREWKKDFIIQTK